MKKFLMGLILAFFAGIFGAKAALSEECGTGAGALVSPISKNLTIEGGGVRLEDTFSIQNQSNTESAFKIYAAPYSEGETEKDFESDTNYTQISRWIKFVDASGGLVDTLEIKLAPCAKRDITFRVLVPDSIPDGGQYAVVFTESENPGGNSVITSSSRVGMLIYAHVSGGETVRDTETTDAYLGKGVKNDHTVINAGAKVANKGNIDIDARGTLVVKTIFGREVYNKTTGASLLPGSAARKIENVWEDAPFIGLFKAEYTVIVDGVTEVVLSRLILILPLPIMVLMIFALVVVVAGIVAFIKKRRSRKLF